MRVGLVITCFNRARYLETTFQSLKRCYTFPDEILIIDDCSTDKGTYALIEAFDVPTTITRIRNPKNSGMYFGLRFGWKYFYDKGYDVLVNLDPDIILKPYWLNVLLKLHKMFPDSLITGFNTLVSNRHPILETFCKYYTKRTCGGINMMFGRELFPNIESSLINNAWDWNLCRLLSRPVIVSKPSVIQHIGIESTIAGHGNKGLDVDIADDFY